MKLLSLFSGIGAFEKALENLKVTYELVNYCELDRFASKSYSVIHSIPETKNLWDVTSYKDWEINSPIDLLTYGFPCQDISTAGKQKGFEDSEGNKTRSGLFFDALGIIKTYKPKVAICENVKNLTSKKFESQFRVVLTSLEEAGYNNYWKVLNARDFGVPQNRERVIIVSIRKDLDTHTYTFPTEKLPIKDMQSVVEDATLPKFYLGTRAIQKIAHSKFAQEATRIQGKEFCGALLARDYKDAKCVTVPLMPLADIQQALKDNPLNSLLVRKLTPKEYFRLMGFSDTDYTLAKSVNSNTQLYKQAGNSIVVPVLECVFKELFKIINLEDK